MLDGITPNLLIVRCNLIPAEILYGVTFLVSKIFQVLL